LSYGPQKTLGNRLAAPLAACPPEACSNPAAARPPRPLPARPALAIGPPLTPANR